MIKHAAMFLAAVLLLAGCGSTPQPAPGEASAAVSGGAQTASAPALIFQPARVDIPTLGVTDELVRVGLDSERRMEIPDVHETGVYEHAPMPGETGPAILASHVNWEGIPGAFARLHELQPGDDIVITGADGSQLTFDVYRVSTFPKAAFDMSIYADTAGPELRAVTCGGQVVDRSYTDNVVAWARLAAP